MERCDFSSVITIISDHISESKRGNQSDLMYALFDTFAADEANTDETFDEGAVCRWVNGVRKISPRITKYYSDNSKKKDLSVDIEHNILPLMYDSDMAIREIYDLVVHDTTISDGVKQKLTTGYYTHIHTLFSLYKLSKAESEVMRNLALAPHNGVHAKLFALWLELKNMNAVNDLIESGFVKELPGRMIALHPMIQEIAINETKPSVKRCSTLLNTIQFICRLHGNDIAYYHELFDMVESITERIINDDANAYLLFLENVYPYMENYADHAATIRSWYLRDNPPPPARNYESEENESL